MKNEKFSRRYGILCSGSSRTINYFSGLQPEDYYIPTLDWHNKLRPEADEAYLTILAGLSERGIPVPMRVYAAASGHNLDEILGALDQDVEDRKAISEYRDQLKQLQPQGGEEEEEGEGGGFAALTGNPVRPIGVTRRDYQIESKLSPSGRKVQEEKQHKIAVDALVRLAQKENHRTKRKEQRRKEMNSPIYGKV